MKLNRINVKLEKRVLKQYKSGGRWGQLEKKAVKRKCKDRRVKAEEIQ